MAKHARIRHLAVVALTVALGAGGGGQFADATPPPPPSFPAGSLIIPTMSTFQDSCGAVSVYGLIYDVLRAEDWLSTHGYSAIQVHYAISTTKSSPNRCKPTSTMASPGGTGSATWTDGCDFTVSGAAPVVKLVNDVSPGTANDVAFSTLGPNATAYPQYLAHSLAADTAVSYGGGPFIIDNTGSDVSTFLGLLSGTIPARDSANNLIDFTAFRTAGACTFGSTHHVNIHRAEVPFSAEVRKTFTTKPPRLAVLETNNGAAANRTGPLFNNILENYLKNGGLAFNGAQGCPTGGTNVGNAAVCPIGSNAGQIFDAFDFQDLVNNKLVIQDSGVNRYTMLWTPHWELKGTNGPSGTEITAMGYINSFLTGSTGLMGECASISNFEGTYDNGSPEAKLSDQFQTCHISAGSCVGGTNYGIERQPSGMPNNANLKNCTDPNASSTNSCVQFPTPTDEFVQVGDFVWNTDTGHVVGFQLEAATSSGFQPGVTPLIKAYTKPTGTLLGYISTRSLKDNTPGEANILYLGGHDQTGNVAGTRVALQTLLLLGGSTVTPPAITTETSRSTPIAATINGGGSDAVIVGDFNNVQPPPTVPTVVNPADITSFVFPFETGHLHSYLTTSVTGTATALGSGEWFGVTFPPVNATACNTPPYDGSCRVVFTTTDVPSILTGVATPTTLHYFIDSEATNIGPDIATGSTLGAADYANLMHRLIGYNGSTYAPVLGGIDHSTVAVIQASSFAKPSRTGYTGTRPTMAYVGGADGMLHAVCMDVDATHGCGTLGKELWAFVPRAVLPWMRLNKAIIQGSPRVIDAYGSFGSGAASFHTILTFMTGVGDPTSATNAQPAVYALDITDPQVPRVVWEYSIKVPGAARGASTLGLGLALAAGPINVAGVTKNVVYAATSNGGTNGAADNTSGFLVTALDMETGLELWPTRFEFDYTATPRGVASPIPHTGVPGGAVAIDKQGQGFITDVIAGDLYGNLWDLDPLTGISRYTPNPLFRFSTDHHPIGAVPAVYSDGSKQYAVFATGGYYDTADAASWGSGTQQGVYAVSTSPTGTPPLTETSGSADVPVAHNFDTATEASYSQVTVVGGQLFVTTDSSDVNASGFGSGAATGHLYSASFGSTFATTVAIQGGAGSVANDPTGAGTGVYMASADEKQKLTDASTKVGNAVDSFSTSRMLRMLWLRVE